MKRLMTVLCTLLLFAFLAPIASATPELFEGYVVLDGSTFDLINDLSFTGLGSISVTMPMGNGGSHFVGLYVDYEIDEAANTFFNEYGSVTGAPPAGLSWEIDDPFLGDIYDNFFASGAAASALDNTNSVPAAAPNDVAMALGWNFVMTDDDIASISFLISEILPNGFYLAQTDPDSPYTFYLSSGMSITEGGEPVIPEPGTWVLLLTGLTMIGAATKRYGRRS